MPGNKVPCHTLGGNSWHQLSEKVLGLLWGQLPCSALTAFPHPAGPRPSLRQAPCGAPFGRGRGWQSEEDAKVWEVKRLLFFLRVYTNGLSQHTPGAGRETGPHLGLRKPKPCACGLDLQAQDKETLCGLKRPVFAASLLTRNRPC